MKYHSPGHHAPPHLSSLSSHWVNQLASGLRLLAISSPFATIAVITTHITLFVHITNPRRSFSFSLSHIHSIESYPTSLYSSDTRTTASTLFLHQWLLSFELSTSVTLPIPLLSIVRIALSPFSHSFNM